MNYVVDASVFVSAAQAKDVHYADSVAFFGQLSATPDTNVFCPTLLLPEYAASIARRTDDTALAESLIKILDTMKGLRLESLTENRSRRAAKIAAQHRLRGADAVYVALAEETESLLITWDNEMLERSISIVQTSTPTQWLNDQK